MAKTNLLFVFFFAAIIARAQTDTTYLYFDKDGKITAKDQAFYYGKVFKERAAWHRQDFWIQGDIKEMDAYYSDSATKTKDGVVEHFSETGTLDDSAIYERGNKKCAYYYYPNHSGKAYELFDTGGNVILQKGWDLKGKEIPGYIVNKKAEFPGGAAKWGKYLFYRLDKYLPKRFKDGEIEGNVKIFFTVMKDGSVGNIKVEKSSGYPDLDTHALDTIGDSPPWIPAIKFNELVTYDYVQLLTYAKQPSE